jgi:tetratricopeptide (TPR) repeat protein
LKVLLLILLAGVGAGAAVQGSDFAIGRAYYAGGEYKKAAAHFEMALKINPSDANSYYWVGMSYQALADISFPFAGKYNSRARICLTKATELAPERLDYRKELFDFLLDPGSSSSARRQAADMLRRVSPDDPDYDTMQRQFARESKANASADAWLGTLFLAVPRAASRLADLAPVRVASQ